MSLGLSAAHVGDRYASYYYAIDAPGSGAGGLPLFDADGGFKSFGASWLAAVDLSGNALGGGWAAFGATGYSRLLGDAAHTPMTSIRGDRDQALLALGV